MLWYIMSLWVYDGLHTMEAGLLFNLFLGIERSEGLTWVAYIIRAKLQLRFHLPLLLRQNLQLPPQNLPRRRRRNRINKPHASPQTLMFCHSLRQPRHDLIRRLCTFLNAIVHSDVGSWQLSREFLGEDSDDGRVFDFGMGG